MRVKKNEKQGGDYSDWGVTCAPPISEAGVERPTSKGVLMLRKGTGGHGLQVRGA